MNQTVPFGDQQLCTNCEILDENVSYYDCNSEYSDDCSNDVVRYNNDNNNSYVVCCIYSFICFVGATGNGLVIFVVLRSAKMRSATNHYICNLAISDVLFLAGLPLMIVTVVHQTWIFGSVACKIFHILTSLNWFTSVFTLTVMSADRYLAVCHPINSMGYRTPIVSRWICAGVWTASVLVMLPIYFYANTESTGPGGRESCVIRWPHDDAFWADRAFIWYAFVVGFAAPTSLISVFYTLVVVRLRTAGPGTKKSQEKKKTHRKVTKMVLVVIVAYVICWLPYWVFQVLNTFIDEQDWTRTVVHVATVLSYTNSALNPFLYAFLAESFRKSFVDAVCCLPLPDSNRTTQLEHSCPARKATAAAAAVVSHGKDFAPLEMERDNPVGGGGEGEEDGTVGGVGGGGENPSERDNVAVVEEEDTEFI